jgi:hypothetical protein
MSSRIFWSCPSFSIKIAISGWILFSYLIQPAFCQRDYNPNFNHFYMGRQEWTVEDNSPVIINKTGTASGGMNGALPNRPPLPKAGWQGYAPVDKPAANNNLPKAPGSTRPKSASHSKAAYKGHAGNLTGTKSPSGVNAYKPYATYSNPANAPNTGAESSTSTHVKGDLLHWARRTPRQQ